MATAPHIKPVSRIFNFGAGPATMPVEVLEKAKWELVNWHEAGMSVMEMSHRGKEFTRIAAEAESDLRKLASIPANYKVLFLQGGATMQFAGVPMNLLGDRRHADFVNTGEWSKKAIAEFRKFGEPRIAASSEDRNFTYVPKPPAWTLSPDAAYVHVCTNETIGGVEYHFTPDTGKVPLVADMSSHILSRPLDVTRYGLIYAGAQKNIGPSGVTVVIADKQLMASGRTDIPKILRYTTHAENNSLYNTPPTFGIYLMGRVFQWIQRQGGLLGMEKKNREKAQVLYDALAATSFYHAHAGEGSRSLMNVTFQTPSRELDAKFVKEAEAAGLSGLKGHRSVGGMRASIYNAFPREGCEALVAFMKEFERAHR
jgi:phosphoserine aminotransferase